MDESYRRHWGAAQAPAAKAPVVIQAQRLLAAGGSNLPAGSYSARFEVGMCAWSGAQDEVRSPVVHVSNATYGSVWMPSVQAPAKIGLVIQYGAGSTTRSVDMDFRSGCYVLPPCSSVKVGLYVEPLLAGGTVVLSAADALAFAAQVSLAESTDSPQACDVPTFTYRLLPTGTYPMPKQAAAVTLLSEGSFSSPLGQVVSMSAAGVIYPPFTPVRVPGSGSFSYTIGTTDVSGIVQFLLSL